MKRFWGFVKKEFYHIFRDKRSMLILFGIPIAQILLFGYVITNEIKNVRVAIYDKSKDNVTRKITNKILSSGYFILDKNIQSSSEIEQCFKEGKVKEIIIFEDDFANKPEKEGRVGIQIISDASEANTANIVVNYTKAIVTDFLRTTNPDVKVPMQIVPEIRMFYNPELKSVYMFVPGIMAMLLLLISAMMTSISITREKEMGTMEVLLVSPLKPIQIIAGKVIPYIFLSFINASVIITLSFFVFGMPVQGSLILLLLESILFITLALSLGILISTATSSQQIAMLISMVALMLPTMLLSGFIFPIENMPLILQWICQVMPARWFIVILKNIMLKGTGIEYIWKETLVILFMTILFLSLSIKKFKVRLE